MTNPISALSRYIKESRAEMTKVTWPSKSETTRYSILVIAISLFIAVFFAGLDWALNLGLEQLVSLNT